MEPTIGLLPRDTLSDSLELVILKPKITTVDFKKLLSVLLGER